MRGDGLLDRFASVNRQIQLALDALPYHTFDMPEEVQEQVGWLINSSSFLPPSCPDSLITPISTLYMHSGRACAFSVQKGCHQNGSTRRAAFKGYILRPR